MRSRPVRPARVATRLDWLGLSSLGLCLSLWGCAEPEPKIPSRAFFYWHSGVPWIVDDDRLQYLVDTGTPRSFVVPSVAARDDDAFAVAVIDDWDVQGLGAHAEVVITNDLPPAILPMTGPGFGGILAADVLSQQAFMLDPTNGRFVLDEDGHFDEWLVGTSAPTRVPVTVAGGGTSCMREQRCFEHDGHRVLVEVLIEGEPVTALLDTASTYTTMGRALFDRLEHASGHPQVSISRGWDTWDFTRIDALSIGDAALGDVPVRVNPELDTALARLSVETGETVELLVGHSFLLYFMTGVDYPGSSLTLARYVDPPRIETEMFEGFGLWLAGATEGHGSCLPVIALAHDGPADLAGMDIGDCVIELDGHDGATLTDTDVERIMDEAPLGRPLEMTVLDAAGDGSRQTPARAVILTKVDLLPAR